MKQLEEGAGAKLEADAHRAEEAVVTPLRKRRLSGERYERDPKIEALIAELAILSRDALIARATIAKRSDPGSSISSARAVMTIMRPGSSASIES